MYWKWVSWEACSRLEQEQQPCDAAFQERNAHPREAVVDAIVKDVRAIDGQSPRVAQGVDGNIHVHVIHTETVMGPAVHGETAAKPVGFLIDRPELLRAQRLR